MGKEKLSKYIIKPQELEKPQAVSALSKYAVNAAPPPEEEQGLSTRQQITRQVPFLGGETFGQGERSFLGNVFERPGAAFRGGIQSAVKGEGFKEGFEKGAVTPEKVPYFSDIAKEKTKEATGKSKALGLFGKIPVSPGIKAEQFPEFLGAIADTLTNPAEVGIILADVFSGQKVSKQVGKTVDETVGFLHPKKTLKVSKRKPFLDQSRKLDDALGEIDKTMGKEFGGMLDAYGDVKVPIKSAQEAVSQLPSNVASAIAENPNIVFEAQGNMKPTVMNLHEVRQTIADFITGKDFLEFTTKKKLRIRQAFNKLGDVIKDVDRKNIAPVYQRYSDWVNLRNSARQITRTKGRPVSVKLKRTISGRGEELAQETLETLAKLFPKANEILIRTKKLSNQLARREIAGRVLGTAGRIAATGAIFGGLSSLGMRRFSDQ